MAADDVLDTDPYIYFLVKGARKIPLTRNEWKYVGELITGERPTESDCRVITMRKGKTVEQLFLTIEEFDTWKTTLEK